MPHRNYAALLAAFTSFLSFSLAADCNAAIATPQSEYVGTFTWEGQTLTVGPRSSSRTASGNFQATASPTGGSTPGDVDLANSWVEWGQEAVDNVGVPKRKRQASGGSLNCLGTQVCMNNEGGVPFCLDGRTGGWFGATGYQGNAVTGNYTTPDGTKGNVYKGPCPGSYYEEKANGCGIVPAEQREEEPSASASASGSASPTSETVSSATTDSAADSMWKQTEVLALLAGAGAIALL